MSDVSTEAGYNDSTDNGDASLQAAAVHFRVVGETGPGTLAGRYLRQFWQPVYHSADLEPGRTAAIRIMGQDLTLYRGETGTPHLVDSECPHRRMKMQAGWVEGDSIRCFYHGWAFSGDGQCVEQPAERPNFCHKVKMAAWPVQEYLGLVFAYLGEGAAPALPRYPAFEGEDVILIHDSYTRACHFFNNLENSGDTSHIAFAHHDAAASWDEAEDGPVISVEESCWGATFQARRPSGKYRIQQFGMPNISHVRGLRDDPAVAYREFIAWWVPHDDDRHTQFTVVRQSRAAGGTDGYLSRRATKLAERDLDRESRARDILAGRADWATVEPRRVNMVVLQDDVVQMGVGPVATRAEERLGRGDAAPILQRKLWLREVTRFARGEPLTTWKHDPTTLPVHSDF